MNKKSFLGRDVFTAALSICALMTTYIVAKQDLKDIYSFSSQAIAFSVVLIIHKLFIISFTSINRALIKNNWLLLSCNVIISAAQFWLAWNIVAILTSSSYLRDALIYLTISAFLTLVQNIIIHNYKYSYLGTIQTLIYVFFAASLYLNIFVNDTRVYSLFLQITGLTVIIFEAVLLFFVSQFYIESRYSLDKS